MTKRIRIGWARDPDKQLLLPRRASPTGLELLGWHGTKEDEERHHTESFRPSKDLAAYADGRPEWLPQGARRKRTRKP